MKIYWLRISWLLILGITVMQSCNNPVTPKKSAGAAANDLSNDKPPQLPNSLSDQEKTEGWKLLFDGKTTNDWRAYMRDTFPGNRWEIDDESIHCMGDLVDEHVTPEDIISRNIYKDFELALDWRISEGSNSGIYFLAQENEDLPIWKAAIKMQLIDNSTDESEVGKNGVRKSGALYDLLSPTIQNTRRPGEWNQVRIIVSNGRVEFFQNSEKILEFELWNDEWDLLINKSKYKTFPNILTIGGTDKNGHIGLQDNKKNVWFRNIKIKTVE